MAGNGEPMMPSIFCIYCRARERMPVPGTRTRIRKRKRSRRQKGRREERGWRQEATPRRMLWLSKVLLIKIKFIACLQIKMKTEKHRSTEAPQQLQLHLLHKSVKTISGNRKLTARIHATHTHIQTNPNENNRRLEQLQEPSVSVAFYTWTRPPKEWKIKNTKSIKKKKSPNLDPFERLSRQKPKKKQ